MGDDHGRRRDRNRVSDEATVSPQPPREVAPGDETLDLPASQSRAAETPEWTALLAFLERDPEERFVPESPLGHGGMGVVEAVIDPALGRRLAKKVMAPGLRERPEAVRQFLREARITAQLDHPSIVPVHDLGIDSEGQLYFTMKVISGETLGKYLKRCREEREQDFLHETVDILIKVANALAFAHSRGVVHGDLKPNNIMVGSYGEVYLMDWGLARVLPNGEVSVSGDHDWQGPMGTPPFMAPEQAHGKLIDELTDVFCVGALVYFLLTGHAPHDADSTGESLELAKECSVPPPSQVAKGVRIPATLEALIMQSMAKDPAARPRSMVEVRDRLSRFLRGGEAFPRLHVTAGELILREGEAGEEVYYLLRGRARAFRIVDGEKLPLGEMAAGEVFGEMAILTGSRRTASVEAMEDCTLVVVTPAALSREMEGMQGWMAALTRTLALRFRERE